MNKIKVAIGSGVVALSGLLASFAHAAPTTTVDAAFVSAQVDRSIDGLTSIWTGVLPVLIPFAIGVIVLISVIMFVRHRARLH